MTLTLNLTAEQEAILKKEAKRNNLPVEEYAIQKILGVLGKNGDMITPQDRLKAFDDHLKWIATVTSENTPGISLEEMTREKIYEGRGQIHE
jgi:hypothetical protein